MTLKFRYNDLASLQELIGRHPGRIACVLMEAETTIPPPRDIWKRSKGFAKNMELSLFLMK